MDGRERDIYDHRSVHALLVHRHSEAVAGKVRVILPGTDREPPLPINLVADSDQRELLRRLPHSRTAEISRLRSRRCSGSAVAKRIAGCSDTSR